MTEKEDIVEKYPDGYSKDWRQYEMNFAEKQERYYDYIARRYKELEEK